MRVAAAYIRVSTDDQTEYSPDAQLRAIKNYCEKNDYYLDPAHIYIDEGKSGRKAERRPAFMSMVGAAKRKPTPFEAILCHKFDRFARSREDSVVYKSLLSRECGVKVISITESIDNDKMSLIMESMLEAMAEYYSINLSEEVKKGMTEKARRGQPLSIAPYGYRMVNKQLVIVPEEAAIVRRIYADFIDGKPYLRIAQDCNDRGVRTHRNGLFENRTVDYILHNPTYAGYIRWTPTGKAKRDFRRPDTLIVKGTHDSIVDEATFEAAQKRAEEIKALYRPYYKPQSNPSHWLVGLVSAPCGANMVNSNGYFICGDYPRGKCRERNSIRVHDLEESVLKRVQSDFVTDVSLSIERISEASVATQIDNTVAELRMRLSRTKDAYERGIDSIEEYEANKARLVSEIALQESRRPNAEAMPTKGMLVKSMKAFFAASENQKGESARRFIHRIVWDKVARSISITYYVN